MKSIRTATVAGQFYPHSRQALLDELTNCFVDKKGIGKQPQLMQGDKDIKALIVPHAGYVYSGPIASHAYYHLSQNGFADRFIILGPNHTGVGSEISLMTQGLWQTPLGQVPIDAELAHGLHKGVIQADDTAHRYEHSIEVQLPFLQYCAQDKPFSFVPLSMMKQDIKTAKEIGLICAETIEGHSKKTVLVASTDFSHVGFNYQSMPPPGIQVNTYAQQQDEYAIQKILSLDAEGLIDIVYQKNISMCGYGPVAAVISAAKKLGASKAQLLQYGTSYDVQPGSSCVGYASIILY